MILVSAQLLGTSLQTITKSAIACDPAWFCMISCYYPSNKSVVYTSSNNSLIIATSLRLLLSRKITSQALILYSTRLLFKMTYFSCPIIIRNGTKCKVNTNDHCTRRWIRNANLENTDNIDVYQVHIILLFS